MCWYSCCSCRRLRCTCCRHWCQLTYYVSAFAVSLCHLVRTWPDVNHTGLGLLLLQAVALHLLSALVSADPASTALADALHRNDVPRGLLRSVAEHAPHILLQPAHKAQVSRSACCSCCISTCTKLLEGMTCASMAGLGSTDTCWCASIVCAHGCPYCPAWLLLLLHVRCHFSLLCLYLPFKRLSKSKL